MARHSLSIAGCELVFLFRRQRELGNPTPALNSKPRFSAAGTTRAVYSGNKPPLSGADLLKMLANAFEKEEYRAPKASPPSAMSGLPA